MTSEVCLMNRHAAVLAADSATTVSGWTPSGRETRYFQGANKIFQLSDAHPVGMMIFDSADILNVPWEIVVKAFRAELKEKSFNSVQGYAEEFFEFLARDGHLFPADVQKNEVVRAATAYAYSLSTTIAREEPDPADWVGRFDAIIAEQARLLASAPLPQTLPQEAGQVAAAAWLPELIESLKGYICEDHEPKPSSFEALAEVALWRVLKLPEQALSTTGLVFAGFGDHDIFPSHIHYICSGVVAGHHIVREVGREAITHDTPADLTAFAQKGMIDTFQLGLDRSVYNQAMQCFDSALDGYLEEVAKESGGDAATIKDPKAIKNSIRRRVSDQWLSEIRQEHILPLRRVLAVLPINEMAELAETLINLQSLKEKVTKPSQEVGGPIDVAVITKGEGLVWLKRKHFFDPALNARYMARLGSAYR